MELFGGMHGSVNIDKTKCIIGFDMGHGECAAAYVTDMDALRSAGIMQMTLNREKDHVIHSAIYKKRDTDELGIGTTGKSVVSYFKARPGELDTEIGNGYTKKAALKKFLGIVIKNLKEQNPQAFLTDDGEPIKNDEILLLIGCPSSDDWLREQKAYAKLVREATGISHVVVMPESRAAVIAAVTALEEAHTLAGGYIVLDMGSSTSDCTCVFPSKGGFEFSWNLGASEIERNILKHAMKDKGITVDDIADLNDSLLKIRVKKEEYFNGNLEPICSAQRVHRHTA